MQSVDASRWSESREAVSLLTSLVRNPPERHLSCTWFGSRREDHARYVGERVKALDEVRADAVSAAAGFVPDSCSSAEDMSRWLEISEAVPSTETVIEAVLTVAGVAVIERDLRR
ncbi:hypothetical protein [Sphingomonas panaciterrae]|uniref:hypothetical protein n=1 Tax=Sphingomonas panaciterrae TaxID=1462999 RepID=UPI002FF2BD49